MKMGSQPHFYACMTGDTNPPAPSPGQKMPRTLSTHQWGRKIALHLGLVGS